MAKNEPPQSQTASPEVAKLSGSILPDEGELHAPWENELEMMAITARGKSSDLDALFKQLEAKVAEEPKRSKWYALPTSARYALLFLVMTFTVITISVLKLRPDFSQYPPMRMNLLLSTFTVLLFLHTWLLIRPLHKTALPTWFTHIFLPTLGLLVPIVLALLPGPYHPPHYAPSTTTLIAGIFECLLIGIGLAAPFLFTTHLFARFKPELAFVGMSAAAGGLLSNIALQLLCPKEAPLHILGGHAAVGLILLIGLWLFNKKTKRSEINANHP